MNRTTKTGLMATGIALLSTGAAAQEGGRFGGLEEVVVTARRVEENMQTVPVSVTTIDAEEFTEIRGAQDLTDVSIAPNVDITAGASVSGLTGAPTIFIRGLGQSDFLAVSDPAVGVYLDGVYISRTVGSLMELTDFERIEVLRGPQGTLYGRNTFAGALNVYTHAPDLDEAFGRVSVSAQRFDRTRAAGVAPGFGMRLQGDLRRFHAPVGRAGVAAQMQVLG